LSLESDKTRDMLLNLLLVGSKRNFSNPNFYNKVGITCLFLGSRSETEGGFYGRLNFCERQQLQAGPKIFLCSLSTQSVRGGEINFNVPFCYRQKYSGSPPLLHHKANFSNLRLKR
jgi:hypothetical protein